jgi:outer membrane protein assembly factor BamB
MNVFHLVPYWSSSTRDLIDSSPAVANGAVYVGSNDGKLYAFNASSGDGLWAASTGYLIYYSSPAVANGVVYVGSYDHKLYAFNASSGATLWSTSTGDPIDSSPTVANGVVYIGSEDHKLYAFHLASTTS